jgi:hypothetical protein
MVIGYTLPCPLPPLYSNPGSAPGWGIAYNATFKDRKKETYGVFGLRNEVVTIIFSFLTFFICLARGMERVDPSPSHYSQANN